MTSSTQRTACLLSLFALGLPASAESAAQLPGLTQSAVGFACLAIFVLAYGAVILEEKLHLRKSVPVILAAGAIWALIGYQAKSLGMSQLAEEAVRHYMLEFGELFLFLLSAMTYINTMAERGLFAKVRDALMSKRLSLRQLFWLTGALAFVVSPVADNLTTALLMGTVLMNVAGEHPRFMVMGYVNIVVAANAGGAFSPFGDITTLMVWQKGLVEFGEFFHLLIPSLVNWLVPALLMSPFLEREVSRPVDGKPAELLPGAITIAIMFLMTVALAVAFHAFLHLPPVLGMLTGLGALKLYGAWLSRPGAQQAVNEMDDTFADGDIDGSEELDIFRILEQAEWDTLMFFAGIILCVGGLGTLGYLKLLAGASYGYLGPSWANTSIGLISAILDNIPVMVAVLGMELDMSQGQWLLVTLTAGVGGSLLSIGSAAGVALMGQARGVYTFQGHLRWTWAVALGYAASIAAHFLVNGGLFKACHPMTSKANILILLLILMAHIASAQPATLLMPVGAYGTTVKATLAPGETRAYSLTAEKGQQFTAKLESLEQNGYLLITDSEGQPLLTDLVESAQVRNLDIIFSRSGRYVLEVGAREGQCSYLLEATLGWPEDEGKPTPEV